MELDRAFGGRCLSVDWIGTCCPIVSVLYNLSMNMQTHSPCFLMAWGRLGNPKSTARWLYRIRIALAKSDLSFAEVEQLAFKSDRGR